MIFSQEANQENFPFSLPALPYAKNALAPNMSSETFDFHHGKHHNAYVTNLNKLLENSPLKNSSLEQIILASAQDANLSGIFNNAAQVWNHTFFWYCLSPNGGGKASGQLASQIEKDFGSFAQFSESFAQAGATQFGSGWAWLVLSNGSLKIMKTANAETPITQNMIPILTCDVWEHAYYIDYRNARPNFLTAFLEKMVNWEFAEQNYLAASQKLAA